MKKLTIVVIALASLAASCGADDSSTSSVERPPTVKTLVGECDMSPIDAKGTLRACAAGTSTAEGPGRAFDVPEAAVSPAPLTEKEQESRRQSTRILKARLQAAPDPIDRGFAPAPRVTQQEQTP